TALGSIGLLFVLEPMLAILLPIIIPVVVLMLRLAGRKLHSIAGRTRATEASIIAAAQEHLELLPATKAFGIEGRQQAAFAELTGDARRWSIRETRASALLSPLTVLISAVGAIGIILFVGTDLGNEQSSPAELFTILLYTALLTRPVG